MLAIAWLFRNTPALIWRDAAAAALPILMSAQILLVYALLPDRAALSLFRGDGLDLLDTSLRLGYRSARWASLTTFAMMVTLLATDRMP